MLRCQQHAKFSNNYRTTIKWNKLVDWDFTGSWAHKKAENIKNHEDKEYSKMGRRRNKKGDDKSWDQSIEIWIKEVSQWKVEEFKGSKEK